MAQDRISTQEIVDLFSMEKDSAIMYIDKKGFKVFEPTISSPIVSKEFTLFFENNDDSRLSIGLMVKESGFCYFLIH